MSAPATAPSQAGLQPDAASARNLHMRRAYLSYSGHPKEPLERRQGEPNDNLLISLGRLIVDKGVSFLFGQEVTSQVSDTLGASTKTTKSLTTAKTAPRQDWLDECWRRNKRHLTLQKLATNGGICGHAFARLLDTKPWPRVIVLDPQTVRVDTDPDDIDTVWRYTITPPAQIVEEGEPAIERRTVIQAQAEAGRIVTSSEGSTTWTILDQTFSAGVWLTQAIARWPYPFSPIVDCQNLPKPNDFWGESDLPEDVLAVLDALNRVASHYNKIIRLHAHPKIWTRGMGARSLDVGIDSVINLPSETAELQALEMKSDLASTGNLMDRLMQAISMMVRIPLVAMGQPDNLGAISGVALQIRYQPLIEKTETKRRTYGDLVQELDRRLLAIGTYGDTTLTQQVWASLLPQDPLVERQVWVLDDSLGLVSQKTLSDLAGLDWESEQEQLGVEAVAKQARMPLSPPMGAPGQAPVPGQPVAPGQPQANGQIVPPPAALVAPVPDIAKKGTSR